MRRINPSTRAGVARNKALAIALAHAGASRREIADLLGLSRSAISHWICRDPAWAERAEQAMAEATQRRAERFARVIAAFDGDATTIPTS